MSFLQIKNNAKSYLASSITAEDTSLTLVSGGGSKFPSSTPFHISIDDEIIKVIAVNGDTFTIERGAEGTTPASHSAGASVELRITAGIIQELQTATEELQTDTEELQNTTIRKDGSVPFEADQSMGSHKLTDVADPTQDQDVATKKYVDSKIVGEIEVSSNCDYVEFTGLDGNSAWFYELLCSFKNPTGSDSQMYIYVNGHTTDYYRQWLYANGTDITADRDTTPGLTTVHAGKCMFVEGKITKDKDGRFRIVFTQNRDNPSEINVSLLTIISNFTIDNITSLRIQAAVSGAIGAGSKFILLKVRRA